MPWWTFSAASKSIPFFPCLMGAALGRRGELIFFLRITDEVFMLVQFHCVSLVLLPCFQAVIFEMSNASLADQGDPTDLHSASH
jgi:hypothetical protein